MNQLEDFIDQGDHLIFKANGTVPVRFAERCTPYNGKDDKLTPAGEVAGFKASHSADLVSTGRAVYYTSRDLKNDIKAEEKRLRDLEHQHMPDPENRAIDPETTKAQRSRGGKSIVG